ncbi:MAG: segregation/condensation protein A [Acetobacteraceae bacterium]
MALPLARRRDRCGRQRRRGTPRLELDGFSGPLALLLTLARAQEVDLARLSLPDLLDQLAAALQQGAPLGEKGDWVVMATWLVLLRSRLLPEDAPAQEAAETEADHLRDRLVALQAVQALAAWLDRRPLLGRDVFARGRPEFIGTTIGSEPEIDVVAFLWASLALFDDDEAPDTTTLYRPLWLDLHATPEARERILRLLAETPGGGRLDRFLPQAPTAPEPPPRPCCGGGQPGPAPSSPAWAGKTGRCRAGPGRRLDPHPGETRSHLLPHAA